MKKLLLAAAIATLGLSTAQAAPTLYGKINVTLDQIDNEDFNGHNETQLNSNASRIGVKGEEKLTDNVGVVYTAEWEISADGDESDAQTFKKRNLFAGLKFKDIGTLKAGIFDSYFKTAAGNNQDIFNDHSVLDMTSILGGEERLKNSVGFETDKKLLGGLQFNVMAQQGEDETLLGNNSERDGFGSSVSTSLTYENKDYGFAAAVAGNFGVGQKYNGVTETSSKIASNAIRVTGSYDFSKLGVNGLVLGGLWQTSEAKDDISALPGLKENAYSITTAYAIPSTPWKVKAEYVAATTEIDNVADRKIDQYGVGVDYNFNKQTRFYGVLAQQKLNNALLVAKGATDNKKTVVGLGMEYSF
ncbi:porin [Acinetobacter qingfengensis]|uniref:Porin n=1 Tax=Acinetobacter qingfengensis TaxID=1262585 RepID=A0A1E7RE86_9GAMM|nr:porin [Acinetobacter qingfengensis]KAA8734740.1 porin [Acinetobacter qingfengensis]OEY97658.1 porin [Acinetobacter qingfengensis]